MSRCPFAEWRGPIANRRPGGMVAHPHGLIPHVIVGSLASADAEFKNPKSQLSAHFGCGKDGHLVQWVDTADVAWAEAAGNPNWWSCECEGLDTEPHTPAQVDTLAHLTVWLLTLSPFTLQVTDDVNGQGITSHRCGGKAWGGHSCPGDQRHAQRGEIVARARALIHPTSGVAPMFNPPITLRPLVAELFPASGGHYQLGDDGSVYAWGAPFKGGPNGKPYFAGRTPARIEEPNDSEKAAGKTYVVIATSGERYAYPEV